MRLNLPTFLLITLCCIASHSMSAQFYRWVDENGAVNIQGNIPPEYVKGGYEIIDDKGNVLSVVAPQISDEERLAQEAAKISAEMQQARDEELLKLYRSPTDVDRAMTTWLSRMDMEIRVKQNRIRIKENEFDVLQQQAANQERVGQEVDPMLLNQMDLITLEIEQFNLEIEEVLQRQAESRSEFLTDRERMVVLWQLIYNKEWEEPEASD